VLSGDKVDYRSTSTRTRARSASRPHAAREGFALPAAERHGQRIVVPGGCLAVAAANATPAPSTVAPQALGALRLERLGSERWLSSTLPPEQLFPLVRTFWKDSGFTLVQDRADAGVLETDWAENRAKLPNDVIRNTIGKVFDGAFSTGELDKFRTRVERTATGSDIYITHRGMVEVYTGQRSESTVWQPRPADPQLEGEFLSRLMIKLGAKEEVAKAAVVPAASGPARARVVDGRPAATLQVDDGFDRAWRRVGVALDRSGFTVEDRDRGQGLYFRALRRSEICRQGRARLLLADAELRPQDRRHLDPGALPRLGEGRGQHST
jgi:outer membrane protein assembly factor BamC